MIQCVSQGDGTGIVRVEAVVTEPVLFIDLRAWARRNAQAHPRESPPRIPVSREMPARFASRCLAIDIETITHSPLSSPSLPSTAVAPAAAAQLSAASVPRVGGPRHVQAAAVCASPRPAVCRAAWCRSRAPCAIAPRPTAPACAASWRWLSVRWDLCFHRCRHD